MSTQRLPAQVIAVRERDAPRSDKGQRLVAAAPRLARLLVSLEDECYADARPCPFCDAPEEGEGADGLPHEEDCELDLVLRAAGLREKKRLRRLR